MQNYVHILDFIKFFRSPKDYAEKDNLWPTSRKLKFIYLLVSTAVSLAVMVSSLSLVITKILGFDQSENYLVIQDLQSISPLLAISFLILIGPFFEEVAFRLALSLKQNQIIIGLTGLSIFSFIVALPYLPISSESNFFWLLGFIILAVIAGFVIRFLIPKVSFEKFWTRAFSLNVYFLTSIFALIHGTNYDNIGNFWWLVPLLVLPQFIIGFVIAFVRVKLGFWWGLASHSFYNFLVAIPVFTLIFGTQNVKNYVLQSTMLGTEGLTTAEQTYLSIAGLVNVGVYAIVAIGFILAVTELFKNTKILNSNKQS